MWLLIYYYYYYYFVLCRKYILFFDKDIRIKKKYLKQATWTLLILLCVGFFPGEVWFAFRSTYSSLMNVYTLMSQFMFSVMEWGIGFSLGRKWCKVVVWRLLALYMYLFWLLCSKQLTVFSIINIVTGANPVELFKALVIMKSLILAPGNRWQPS